MKEKWRILDKEQLKEDKEEKERKKTEKTKHLLVWTSRKTTPLVRMTTPESSKISAAVELPDQKVGRKNHPLDQGLPPPPDTPFLPMS